MATTQTSRRILTAFTAATVALIFVAIFLAIQPPTILDPTTPEGTAQGYYQAINDGDQEAALAYLSDDLVQRCDQYALYYRFGNRGDTSISVVIVTTKIDGNEASVDVRVTENYGGEPFGGGTYRHDEMLQMQRRGERWMILGVP